MSQKQNNFSKFNLINKDIKINELLVIDDDGKKIGPISSFEALVLAKQKNLDLLLVSINSIPPVAKLVNYGKLKYEQKKKERKSKKKQHIINNKEIRLRIGIGIHDIEFKSKQVRKFLEEGNRVKISLRFKGREIIKPEFGKITLDKFFDNIKDIAKIEKTPKLNGIYYEMYVVYKK